nr:hypothetical protein [uncultured Devosia sp.]
MIWTLLAIEVLLLIKARRRIHVLSVFDLIALYIMACQLAYYLAPFMPIVDINAAGQLRSHLHFNDEGLLLYFWIFVCCHAATLGLTIAPAQDAIGVGRQAIARQERWLGPVLLTCVGLALVNMASIDGEALWYNNRYLMLSSTTGLAIDNGVTALVQALSLFIGVIAGFGLVVAMCNGRRGLALGFAIVVLWYLLMGLANAGRAAAVYCFVIAAVAGVMAQRHRAAVVVGAVGLALLALLMALSGRASGEFGIAVLPGTFTATIAAAPELLLAVFGNLTQGIFVTNDGFLLNPQHPELYKLLSFSPLPSALDGFDEIRRIQGVRLHDWVPMSAITEVIAFGPLHAAAAMLSLMLGMRLSLLAAGRGHVLVSVLAGTWIFLIFVQASAYPLRNVFRQELMILALLSVVLWFGRPARAASTAAAT